MRITLLTIAICVLVLIDNRVSCHSGHQHHHPHPPPHHHPYTKNIPRQADNYQDSSSSHSHQHEDDEHKSSLDDSATSNNNSNQVRVVSGPDRMRSIKYCADLSPLKEFLSTQIEPYYTPLITLLPEDLQLVLLDETSFGGFSNASCLLAASGLAFALVAWFAVVRVMQTSAENTSARLNEQLLALKLTLNQANLKSNIFEHEISKNNHLNFRNLML